jgi:hypothetical protein
VRTLCGNTITLDAESTDSIATIKDKVFNKVGTPAQHQRLAFAGNQLQDVIHWLFKRLHHHDLPACPSKSQFSSFNALV